ncbi:hypothetical protein [Streptomyces sp. NPDC088785]|uniref:hypothetical protein n=1 Tax=Streptomyces sp. NPDC088785 TaxID=3365897 RepID=UPI003818F682
MLETFAWVEVVTAPDAVARSRDAGLEEVDIEGPLMPPGLEGPRAERDAQRAQGELAEDGTAVRSGPDDWPFNPPIVDLFDPVLVKEEISRSEFEQHWS